jgi:DNA phosphorothioation-associated putative methyltransferase
MSGKRVGGALYFHVSALGEMSREIQRAVNVAQAEVPCFGFNVVKFEGRAERRISLLSYQDFDETATPALLDSWTLNIETGKTTSRSYRTSLNPPILHRKELLLRSDDPRRDRFAGLTAELEQRGLFTNSKAIGFQRQWRRILRAYGIEIKNHMVLDRRDGESEDGKWAKPEVARYRTALSRQALSTPMQLLARHGFLEGDLQVFDYGCGRGDDVGVLSAAGLSATGWDPHYAPNAKVIEADVVNLGYVLNVIEDPAERADALRRAFGLTKQVLAVAVMLVGQGDTAGLKRHGDGYVTGRGTFQKYFTQEEARTYIEETIGVEAIPVAPGTYLAFRNKVAEQRFLEGRSRRRRDISHLLAIAPPAPEAPPAGDQALLEEHRELVDGLWERALQLGRLPYQEELNQHFAREIREQIGSIRKAAQLAQVVHDPAGLPAARQERVQDLTVYFALTLFNRRQKYGELPPELQRDIKAFFGSYKEAEEAGRQLLFSVNQTDRLLSACQQSVQAGNGHLFEQHSLQIHAELIDRLPAILRVYVGCAEKLYGSIDSEAADLVKIHVQSGKLSLLRFDDFHNKPLPRLVERIKINMPQREVDFFDYANDKAAPRLTMKSRYMACDQHGYERQASFDRKLDSLGLFELEGYGPDAATLARGLTQAGYRVAGFDIVPK